MPNFSRGDQTVWPPIVDEHTPMHTPTHPHNHTHTHADSLLSHRDRQLLLLKLYNAFELGFLKDIIMRKIVRLLAAEDVI